MPISISGLSGIDSDGLVQKLVEVESRPIKQLEIRKKNLNIRKDSLKNLGRMLEDINSAAKELYGLKAAYNNKNAASSDTSVLEAKAGRNAEEGVRKIKVIQTATGHTVSSDPVTEGDILPSGRFTIEVNGEKAVVNFKGGKLKNLKEEIDAAASELVSSSYIKKSGDTYILTIQSKRSGEKGEIKISGGMDLLKKIGLVDGEKGGAKSEVALPFDSKYFGSYVGTVRVEAGDGNISVSPDGKTVTIKGLLWREYSLPVEVAVKDDMNLEFDVRYRDRSEDEESAVPRSLTIGPRERVNIKGIILEGYNVSRTRKPLKSEEKRNYDSLMGVGIIGVKEGKRVEIIYPIDTNAPGRQTIAAGKDFKNGVINKIIFYCNRGVVDFSNARLATPVDQKGLLALKNTIFRPQDAKVVVDGIEVTRDRNDGLNDIIKGVTLNLKRPSQHEVDLTIDHNIDIALEKIKKFVEVYNKYLDYHRELTRAAKAEKPGDFTKTLSQSGLFMGDISLLRLESLLKTTINSAYPSRAEKPIKVFAQMGVSTGALNAEWDTIKSGKLIIDENLLKKSIRENPEGVALFFGSDTDGDNKTDNGAAYKVVYVLKPYMAPGKNIIASRIDLEDNSIKLTDETIKQKEDHLKKYEEKLKFKFGQMERAISESNAKKQWMKYQLEGFSGNNAESNKNEK